MPRMADERDLPHAIFVRPDLGSFCRLDELGLQVAGYFVSFVAVRISVFLEQLLK